MNGCLFRWGGSSNYVCVGSFFLFIFSFLSVNARSKSPVQITRIHGNDKDDGNGDESGKSEI